MKDASITATGSALTLSAVYDGDYLTTVTVETGGFAGHGNGHIVEAEFIQFSNSLDELARTRKGQASVASISSEIQVTLAALDSLGHLGVSGQLLFRKFGQSSSALEEQSLSFTFEFDPDQIESFAHDVRAFLASSQ